MHRDAVRAEAEEFADRIKLAARAGFDTIEFWGCEGKDVGRLHAVASDENVRIGGFLAEPMIALAEPRNHDAFLAGLKKARDNAIRLRASTLVVVAGDRRPDTPREEQRAAIVDCLRLSADALAGSGITLALEPINSDERPNGFLSSTREGLDIVDEVGRPEVKLLYDMFHSAYMGETFSDVLAGRVDRIAHVHLADHPGRHEPGTGGLRWREGLAWLRSNGYRGLVGLEYRPLGATVEGLSALG